MPESVTLSMFPNPKAECGTCPYWYQTGLGESVVLGHCLRYPIVTEKHSHQVCGEHPQYFMEAGDDQ